MVALDGSWPVWTATLFFTMRDSERVRMGLVETKVSPNSHNTRSFGSDVVYAASPPRNRSSFRKSASASGHVLVDGGVIDGAHDLAHDTAPMRAQAVTIREAREGFGGTTRSVPHLARSATAVEQRRVRSAERVARRSGDGERQARTAPFGNRRSTFHFVFIGSHDRRADGGQIG